jgi:hypothetical protein
LGVSVEWKRIATYKNVIGGGDGVEKKANGDHTEIHIFLPRIIVG